MWVAREKNGLLRLYTEKPIRKESGIWYLTDDSDCMTIDPSLFIHLTWDDEPIEVEIISKEMHKQLVDFMNIIIDMYSDNPTLVKPYPDDNEDALKKEFIKYLRSKTGLGYGDLNGYVNKFIDALKVTPMHIMDKPNKLEINWK